MIMCGLGGQCVIASRVSRLAPRSPSSMWQWQVILQALPTAQWKVNLG